MAESVEPLLCFPGLTLVSLCKWDWDTFPVTSSQICQTVSVFPVTIKQNRSVPSLRLSQRGVRFFVKFGHGPCMYWKQQQEKATILDESTNRGLLCVHSMAQTQKILTEWNEDIEQDWTLFFTWHTHTCWGNALMKWGYWARLNALSYLTYSYMLR